jgi:hypothetical protein
MAASELPVTEATAPEVEGAAAAGASLAPRGELSGWRLMLDELDELLRDPALTRALASFVAKLVAGARGLGAAAKRLAGSLARLRLPLPRRLLLALLALALPLALLALLTSSGDKRVASGRPARPAGPIGGARSPGAVGMPNLLTRSARVRPVKVALVLDHTYGAGPLRRELRALGTWLAEHHAAGTRVSVIDAGTARASVPLRDSDLARARPTQPRPSTTAAIRSALGRQTGRQLLVTLGSAAPASSTASTLRVATRRGASAGSSVPLRRGKRSRVTIDDRRPDALAASVARAIMAVSGQRERR